VSAASRVRQIELAMERARWLPHIDAQPFVAINIPMFQLWAAPAPSPGVAPPLSMGVIVGKALKTRTPVLAGEMRFLIFRPYWNVPRSILHNELLPQIERNPQTLQRQDMEIVRGAGDNAVAVAATPENLTLLRQGALRLRQRPGPQNSLGLVKFVLPNEESIYLHGTPAQQLFSRSRRDFSHGCVRVEDPVGLAEWVLQDQPQWTRERILAAMQGETSRRVDLARPIPVILYYVTTAVLPPHGAVHFADDLYGHDLTLERALARARTP
jgi:murein L,D-transpeptidase YcbB/YkuD